MEQTEKHKTSWGYILFILIFVGAGFWYMTVGSERGRPTGKAVQAVQSLLDPQGVVNMTKYLATTEGMTYAQVVATIGREGDEQASAQVGAKGEETTLKVYHWKNPDGSGMSGTFENGVLKSKVQLGLH